MLFLDNTSETAVIYYDVR